MIDISIGVVLYNNHEDAETLVKSIERVMTPTLSKRIYLIDNSAGGGILNS